MNTKLRFHILNRWVVAFLACAALATCAAPGVVDHAFEFDTRDDNQDAVVLNYRYGDSKLPGASADEERVKAGGTVVGTGVHGPMRRGDFLYVKWRINGTGQVYEDTVDLRHRLPRDIKDHRITFLIRGPQLYVFLVPPDSKKRPPGVAPNGPRMYSHLDVKTIYPDQSKP